MDTEKQIHTEDKEPGDEITNVISKASALVSNGNVLAARRLIKQALVKAQPADKDRLYALDKSLRMDPVAKLVVLLTAIALIVVAYISLMH